METIKSQKKIDCLTALEVFRQIPINTTGKNWSKEGVLNGSFHLQANPKDERFDPRYVLTVEPWTPYLFKLKDGSEDFRLTIKDFAPYPGSLGGFGGSLLVSGKRPMGLNLKFDNYLDRTKAWSYLMKDYISDLINAGYNHIGSQNQTIAEIFANRDTRGESENRKEGLEEEQILIIKPNKVELKTGDVFGNPLINDQIYKTICDLVN